MPMLTFVFFFSIDFVALVPFIDSIDVENGKQQPLDMLGPGARAMKLPNMWRLLNQMS